MPNVEITNGNVVDQSSDAGDGVNEKVLKGFIAAPDAYYKTVFVLSSDDKEDDEMPEDDDEGSNFTAGLCKAVVLLIGASNAIVKDLTISNNDCSREEGDNEDKSSAGLTIKALWHSAVLENVVVANNKATDAKTGGVFIEHEENELAFTRKNFTVTDNRCLRE
jgi:hypothetical protein